MVRVSKRLWIWDQMPLKQSQRNYKCFEWKDSFISYYHSLWVTTGVSEEVDRGNHWIVGRSTDLVNPFR